jgi:hypothetical protein
MAFLSRLSAALLGVALLVSPAAAESPTGDPRRDL